MLTWLLLLAALLLSAADMLPSLEIGKSVLAEAVRSPLISVGSSFLAAAGLTPLVARLARHRGWMAYPRDNRWHARPVAMMGGLALYAAVAVALMASGLAGDLAWPVSVGATLLFAVGLADDLTSITPGVKLLAQMVATVLVLYADYAFWQSGPVWLSVPLTFLWVIGITNAINLIDGMDGLAAGIAMMAAGVLALMAGLLGATALTSMAAAVAGAAAGFLLFNAPPARIFMGDSGSMFLGFALAFLGIAVQTRSEAAVHPAAVLVPVVVLAVPIFDTVLVTVLRAFNGRPLTQGGTDHAMHRLARLGLSEYHTVLFLCSISGMLGVLALIFYVGHVQLFIALFLFTIVALAMLGTYVEQAGVYEAAEEVPDAAGQERALTEKLGAVLHLMVGRRWKVAAGMMADLLLVPAAFLLAHALHFEKGIPGQHKAMMLYALPAVMGGKVLVFYATGLYHGIWRFAGTPELVRIGQASAGASLLTFVGLGVAHGFGEVAETALFLDWMIVTLALAGARLSFRGLRQYLAFNRHAGKRVLLYGAGRPGVLALRHLRQDARRGLRPVGFIDDDPRKRGRRVQGLPVLGSLSELPQACKQERVTGLIITAPQLSDTRKREICAACQEVGVSCHHLSLRFDVVPSGHDEVAAGDGAAAEQVAPR